MERREFLTKSGAVFTAAMFSNIFLSSSYASTGNKTSANKTDTANFDRRPNPDDFSKAALMAIAYGINTPNPHNTQAWKFKLLSDDDFLLYIDESRLLTETDPPSRQMHIGCGCFLATLEAGMSLKGYKAEFELFPEGSYSLSETGTKPVAKVILKNDKFQPLPYSDVIFTRKTNRLKYTGNIIEKAEFDSILTDFPNQYSQIILENGEHEMAEITEFLHNGMEVECRTHNTYEETRVWFRLGDDKALKRDGINLDGTVDGKLMIWILEKTMKGLDHDTWHKEKNVDMFLKNYRKAIETAKGIVWFKTDTNNHYDWVKTGMDYATFQLAAYKKGIFIHPMSQILQEYKEMDELRDEFNKKMGITEPEKIQMIIRIGRSKEPFYSYRRNVQEFII